MEGATRRLEAENLKGAQEDEEEALAELNRAREDLEEELAEREEENQEETARRLVARLSAMLAEQELVSAETKDIDRRTKETEARPEGGAARPPEGKETPPEDEAGAADARSLARRERSLATDAEDILRVLEADQTSVAAPALIERVRADLESAAARLDASETGEPTQIVQADIERTLRELIEALTPPQRPPRSGQGQGQPRRRRPRDIVTAAMELKMIHSAQRRVRERAEKLAKLGLLPPEKPEGAEPGAKAEEAGAEAGEKVNDHPEGSPSREAAEVARAEEALAGVMEAFIEKYPIIDALLLGAENESAEREGDVDIPIFQGEPKGRGEDGDRKDDRTEGKSKEGERDEEKEK
jgi:hypothetical protein